MCPRPHARPVSAATPCRTCQNRWLAFASHPAHALIARSTRAGSRRAPAVCDSYGMQRARCRLCQDFVERCDRPLHGPTYLAAGQGPARLGVDHPLHRLWTPPSPSCRGPRHQHGVSRRDRTHPRSYPTRDTVAPRCLPLETRPSLRCGRFVRRPRARGSHARLVTQHGHRRRHGVGAGRRAVCDAYRPRMLLGVAWSSCVRAPH